MEDPLQSTLESTQPTPQAQHPSPPKMMPVKSSTVSLVGYDPKGQTLHIQFKSSPQIYIYQGVSSKTFSEFMNAKSKGLYHANAIKNKYKFQKVKPTPPQL